MWRDAGSCRSLHPQGQYLFDEYLSDGERMLIDSFLTEYGKELDP
jgi:hypothetical protein